VSANSSAGRKPADASSAERVGDFLTRLHHALERRSAEVATAEARGIDHAKTLVVQTAREVWPEAFSEGERRREAVHGKNPEDA